MILYQEGDTKLQEAESAKVLAILCAAYPGHPWAVTVKGGVIFIRHLQLGSNWGMNVKFANVSHDAAVLKREVIMMAGEWLERAGLVRGRENGDEIYRVEGVPEKYQPRHAKPPIVAEAVIAAEPQTAEMRTEARPQVQKAIDGG